MKVIIQPSPTKETVSDMIDIIVSKLCLRTKFSLFDMSVIDERLVLVKFRTDFYGRPSNRIYIDFVGVLSKKDSRNLLLATRRGREIFKPSNPPFVKYRSGVIGTLFAGSLTPLFDECELSRFLKQQWSKW